MSLQKYLLLFIICGIYTLTFTGQHVTELIWKKTENQWIWKSAYVGYITNVLYASTHRYHCSADFSICLSQTTKIIPDSSSSLLPQLSIKLALCGHCGTRLWKWVWCRCFSWLTKQLHLQLRLQRPKVLYYWSCQILTCLIIFTIFLFMRKRKFSHDSEQLYTLTAFIGTERVRGSQELLIKMIINECEHIYKSRCFGRGQSMICLCNTYWTIQPPAARKNFVFAKWVLVVPRGCWLLLSEITSIEGTVSKTSWCLNCSASCLFTNTH